MRPDTSSINSASALSSAAETVRLWRRPLGYHAMPDCIITGAEGITDTQLRAGLEWTVLIRNELPT